MFWPGESPWTGEPGGLQSMGSQGVGHDRATKHSTEQCVKKKKKEVEALRVLNEGANQAWGRRVKRRLLH